MESSKRQKKRALREVVADTVLSGLQPKHSVPNLLQSLIGILGNAVRPIDGIIPLSSAARSPPLNTSGITICWNYTSIACLQHLYNFQANQTNFNAANTFGVHEVSPLSYLNRPDLQIFLDTVCETQYLENCLITARQYLPEAKGSNVTAELIDGAALNESITGDSMADFALHGTVSLLGCQMHKVFYQERQT